ncbi:muellerian-inhibiting factor [Hemitrygon akajei]|uniref:muellerian-inhibiting factor n=1 Tax=Hemitrygon akajei TaxID=2704970 RepID=UPI003BF9EB68
MTALPVERNIRKVQENVEEPTGSLSSDFPDLHSAKEQGNCSTNDVTNASRHQELDRSWRQKHPSVFKEPVCRLQSDEQRADSLEVIGATTGYERGFIEDVVLYSDRHVTKFGICSAAKQKHSALLLLRNLAFHIKVGTETVKLMVLHLSEVSWKGSSLQLQFKMALDRDLLQLIEESETCLLVFYLGRNQGFLFEDEQGFRFSEIHLEEYQMVCFHEDTKYVILRVRGGSGRCEEGQMCIDVSLKIRHHSNDVPVVKEELQQLLFGFDEKRFTRMTPALFFLVRELKDNPMESSCTSSKETQILPPIREEASRMVKRAEDDHLETLDLPFHSASSSQGSPREFLRQLNRFLNVVLDYSTDQNSRSVLQLDKETIESLPHQSLNISNAYVLELLVQSEEPLVFLLPENAENFLEQIIEHGNVGETEEKIQHLFLTKLKNTINKVLEIPVFQKEKVLKKLIHLLNECNYPFPLPEFPQVNISPQDGSKKINRRQKTYYTFLLLKTLQTVKTFWDKRQKIFRQNRSATNRSICKLEELSIDFERLSYDWILVPKLYNIHNCVGSCSIPLTGNVSNHVVLLIKMQEQGLPTKREPCCVPVEYSELLLAVVNDQSSMITVYKNMVAEECKCR